MISILIPLYNGIEFLDDAVQSVKDQTFTEWEVIIGVNGHPANSVVYQAALKYADNKIRVIDLHDLKEKGKSAALNKMLEFVIYEYIAILDADDIWHPTKLESQVPVLKLGYDVVGTQCLYFGDRGGSPSIPIGDISQLDFFKGNPVINSSAIIKKELCWWDGSLNLEDYDLWLRLRNQNKRFYNCIDYLVKHRIHTSSSFNSKGNGNRVPELLERHRKKQSKKYRIRIFSAFCDSTNCKSVYERLCQTDLMPNYGVDKDIYITDGDDYTHAILMNCPFVDLNIPKENVIGLAFEPPQFLKVSQEFAQYVEKHVGRYFIGDSTGLPATFINKYAFMWHLTPPRREPVKDRLMSIMVSQKTEAPGHLYRHELVRAILATDLDIHIYGRGCQFYQGDPRVKGGFDNDDEPHERYHFHICIENFQTEAYTSEKYTNAVLWGTTPIYWGSRTTLFPENTIVLSGDVINDILLIRDIVNNPAQYKRKFNQTVVRSRLNLLKNLDDIFC
jgi:glycosyltransferase involved in cell wall biosynthesis